MAEQISWDRKYRPKTEDDYIGNSMVKDQLALALSKDRLPQTLMFEGPMGTGKTTMARLLAKNLMCPNAKENGGHACNKCSVCRQLDDKYILQGGNVTNNFNIHEYNIAQANGVADAEKIVAQMKEKNFNSKANVAILDEVQQMTPQAQQTFLKIVEEPAPNLYIIFCTTDPQDLNDALRSRLTSYKIKRPSANEIAERLARICEAEGVDYSKTALELIATKSDRIIRSSIKNAELLATYGDIKLKQVEAHFGVIKTEFYVDYLNAAMTGKLFNITKATGDLAEKDVSTKEFISGLGDFLVTVLNAIAGVKMDAYAPSMVKKYRKFGKQFTEEQLTGLFQLVREYRSIKADSPYYLYSLAIEIGQLFKVTDDHVNIDATAVETRYYKNTKKINATSGGNVKPRETTSDDLRSIFGDVKEVKDAPKVDDDSTD